ncbi:FAD-binding oxidoreductase [Candidatus Sumerlaeota bacterium]|nr:FAD-binding oxidoreductase [Candidatus Sumerlaeota bacterium]
MKRRRGPTPVVIAKPERHATAKAPAPAFQRTPLLPDHLEWVEAWGMASKSMSYVFRPSTLSQLRDVFSRARAAGRSIALKGGGRSYGDAFQNNEEFVLDLSRMNRVLDWNPETGIIVVEPGLRIAELWRYIIGDGYWPPVVSGTMETTIGGCASMNIHGKNAYEAGTFGDHITEFDIMLPSGELKTVSRESDGDLFRAAISGFGMLGVFTKISLRMKRIYSGNLEVHPRFVRNFHEMVDAFDENEHKMDYMVGWSDCFASGRNNVGRGEMHFARHLEPGEDHMLAQTLRVKNQDLPDLLLHFIPKSILHRLMAPFVNDFGMRAINTAKWTARLRPAAAKPYLQSHAAFAFLLDYIPQWKLCYRPGGLIQYQSFVPADKAAKIFTQQIRMSQARGILPYLAVTKKHKRDDFLISHGVDGFSLALDYPVTASNKATLWKLCHDMDELVLAAGGRFYFAKDSTMRQGTPARYLGADAIHKFAAIKAACDPEGILCTNLYRRLFGQPKQAENMLENAASL